MPNSRPCPYPGCDFPVLPDRRACPIHWRILPLGLRRRINRAWKSQKWSEHRAALAEAFAFYRGVQKQEGVDA